MCPWSLSLRKMRRSTERTALLWSILTRQWAILSMTSVGGNIIEARKVVDALSILRSRDSDAIYLAIQILLQKTSDNDVEIVSLEKYPQLLPTVVDIMNEYNPLKSIYTSTIEFKEPGPIDYANDLFSGMGRIESWPERIHFLDNSRYKVSHETHQTTIYSVCFSAFGGKH